MSAASPSEVMMTNKVGPMYDESLPEVIGTVVHSKKVFAPKKMFIAVNFF